MSAETEEVRKAILSILEGKIPLVSSWCTVKTVNDKTCDVIFDDDEDLVIYDILLGFDKSGVVVKPKVNSDVLVLFINNTKTTGAVVMVEETEDIEIMGNEFEGIPKVGSLVGKLNALENKVNDLITFSSGHTHAYVNVATAAVTATASGPVVGELTNTIVSDIENTKVKHGNG